MAFQPMPLSRRPEPFDHPEWIFELKYDGFRSLAVIHGGRTELISATAIPSTPSQNCENHQRRRIRTRL
jgi:bifunctional non-homologous end joining protein LigD